MVVRFQACGALRSLAQEVATSSTWSADIYEPGQYRIQLRDNLVEHPNLWQEARDLRRDGNGHVRRGTGSAA